MGVVGYWRHKLEIPTNIGESEIREGKMKSYRDLDVYQLAHKLGLECHRFSMLLPKFEMYETGSQLRRASKSGSANIVEGFGRRRYKAEYIRFLIFSHASIEETIEWLEYIHDLYLDLADQANQLIQKANVVGAKLNRFIQVVARNHRPGSNPA
jgi:four helix bundle protein